MARKVPETWAIFDQHAPRHQSRWFQSITILGLVFLVIERVWQAWSYSKSWHILNYQISNPTKTYNFFAWFLKNSRKRVSKSGVLWPIAWAGVIKMVIWFFKIVPLGAPRSLIQMVSKRMGVFIEMDLLPTVITNSFKIQNQTFEQHFHFLLWLYDHEIYSFLETSARFIMTKVSETQVHPFHAHADIKAVFTFLKKHIHEWKHSW